MGNDAAEGVQALAHSHANIKVHRLMCMELMKFVDRISQILPAIESARPRCSTGMQALCSLNLAIEKANLLLQHCGECSKLYLAITGEAIMLRCERVCNALELSLSQIQNMVPLLLAAQISGIVDDLRAAKFTIQSSEEEAGKVVLASLRQGTSASNSTETSEFEAFQLAAVRLHLTSPKALLIEKRSIKNLLDKVRDTDPRKEGILKYLLYLLRKYGRSIGSEQTENASDQYEGLLSITNTACNSSVYGQSIEQEPHIGYGYDDEAQTDVSKTTIPAEEFRCPISLRLMHDPVVIASGQTFERVWIEKWFQEGHDTCPKTRKKLSHLSMTPNYVMKDLISKWCERHGISIPSPCSQRIPAELCSLKTSSSDSIASFGSSLNDVHIPIDVSNVSLCSSDASFVSDSSHVKIVDGFSLASPQMNDNSHRCQSSASSSCWMSSGFLSKLAELPWESQCKAMEDVKNHLKEDDQACHSLLSNSSNRSLIRFLKDACNLCDVKAQRDGAQVLLALLKSRCEIPSLSEDMFCLLASFLDSEITEEALSIIEVLSGYQYCKSKIMASGALPSILKILDSQIREFQVPAVKILYDLSSNRDIGSHILSLGCIPKLISLLRDSSLARHCIKLLKNLCDIEEARVVVAETNGCIASIAELLESGSREEEEHALAILLSLCSQRIEYCRLVLKEGVIPSLVNISVNGNTRGKMSAMELLRLLRDIRYDDSLESSPPHPGSNLEFSQDPSNCSQEKKPSSKAPGFFARKFAVFSKPRSLALF